MKNEEIKFDIEIPSEKHYEKDFEWTDKDTGEVHKGRSASQLGYFFKEGEKYPEKFYIPLAEERNENDEGTGKFLPHEPGKYNIAPTSVYVDKYKNLTMKKTLDLIKIAD
jgi:hypothetical protein